jgi:hypothetical protein
MYVFENAAFMLFTNTSTLIFRICFRFRPLTEPEIAHIIREVGTKECMPSPSPDTSQVLNRIGFLRIHKINYVMISTKHIRISLVEIGECYLELAEFMTDILDPTCLIESEIFSSHNS